MKMMEYFNSAEFEERYHYEGKLGAFLSGEGTQFYLWAPTAERVVLKIFRTGDGEEIPRMEEMCAMDRGVWKFQTVENLDGFYYQYEVTVAGNTRTTADPYAKACGVNGYRSMVIDLSRTNPQGWEKDQAPEKQAENIIYEIHVKDFTWDPSSGVSDVNRGKYLGLTEAGTTLHRDGIHVTGLDYLKELGITHVQLMPVYDYGSVDEAGGDDQFNWGYDPVNYNVPEGSYSSDPFHAEVRIRELKQVIQTFHENGFRVIMDVVYNHTYQLDSFLERTVPGYYYRFEENGSSSNGSGCGNDTASERSMCAKYILDSILYWTREYHFDGYRFDLMGLLPVELMNRIRTALDEEFGEGRIMLFGEPWRASHTAAKPGTILADKENLKLLHPQVGAFCDATRDAVKGSVMEEQGRGFVNGGRYDAVFHSNCMKGWAGIRGEYSVNEPSQTIGYMSCHDDWTLWDRLVKTMDPDMEFGDCKEEVCRASKLAIAFLFGCQGSMFLLSGEEAGRTKCGIKNTYNSPISVNRIDWERIWKMEFLKEYYRGLFALRKLLPCLCDKSDTASQRIRSISWDKEKSILAEFVNADGECRWKKVILIYNMSEEVQKFILPDGNWHVLADDSDTFLWEREIFERDVAVAAPMSAKILGSAL